MDSELREAVKKFIEDWRPAMDGFYRKTPYNAFIPLIAALRAVPVSAERHCVLRNTNSPECISCEYVLACYPASPAAPEGGEKCTCGFQTRVDPACPLHASPEPTLKDVLGDMTIGLGENGYPEVMPIRPAQPAAQSAEGKDDIFSDITNGDLWKRLEKLEARYQAALDVVRMCVSAIEHARNILNAWGITGWGDLDTAIAAASELLEVKHE
jgi:hypothetical protein